MKIKMDRRILALAVILIAIFTGVLFPYFTKIYAQDSKIAQLNTQERNLNTEAASLNSQISNLTSQINNLTTANLTDSLTVTENLYESAQDLYLPPYNYFDIEGYVNNTMQGTAYNAGLKVVAYTSYGALEINMTVPFNGLFVADKSMASSSFGLSYPPLTSLHLGTLYGNENTAVSIVIYHEGIVSNWTVTPVWTNTP